jgi:DNA-binding NtrC family response regulator
MEHGNVRILAASNVSLPLQAESGAFRSDLLYRLRILCLELAPLRERKGDVERLAAWYLEACDRRFGLGSKSIHPDSLAWMDGYHWPGNIRELENLIYREYLLSESPLMWIEPPKALKEPVRGTSDSPGDSTFSRAKAKAVETFERGYLVSLLDTARGNISLAARLAGKERRSLGKLLKKHGLGGTSRLPGGLGQGNPQVLSD